MNKNIRNIGIVIVVILVAFGILKSTSKSPVPGIIKIGVTAPLTGNLAFLGEGYKNGINLALKNIKGTKHRYEAVFEDDKFSPATGASTASKLINVDKVNVIVSFGSPVGNVVSPIAEQNKIVHLNGIASDQNVAKGDYNFVHWTPPYEESRLLISELKKKNFGRVGVFVTNQPGTMAVANQVKTDLTKNSIALADYEVFNGGEKDFRSYIGKMKATNPEILIVIATSPELEVLVQQIKDLGIKTPLTSIEAFEFSEKLSLFEGSWYVNAADPTDEFTAMYKKAYGSNPTLGAANGYDIVNLIVKAVEKEGTESDAIKAALYEIQDYPGAVGSLSVDRDGLVLSKAVVRMIKDGKPVTIK